MTAKITVGRTQKLENNSSTVHIEDRYYLVIGFEVNQPQAYSKVEIEEGIEYGYHNAASDPGHTFIYLVKNQLATLFFSLGPLVSDKTRENEYYQQLGLESKAQGREKGRQIAKEYIGEDPFAAESYERNIRMMDTMGRAYGRGTPDYHIPEKTRLFKIVIDESVYQTLYQRIQKHKKEINEGRNNYNIFNNYTCAAVAREIIGDSISGLPWGRSAETISMIHAINPYAFYTQMKEYKTQRTKIWEYEIKDDEELWNRMIEALMEGKRYTDRIIIDGVLSDE